MLKVYLWYWYLLFLYGIQYYSHKYFINWSGQNNFLRTYSCKFCIIQEIWKKLNQPSCSGQNLAIFIFLFSSLFVHYLKKKIPENYHQYSTLWILSRTNFEVKMWNWNFNIKPLNFRIKTIFKNYLNRYIIIALKIIFVL